MAVGLKAGEPGRRPRAKKGSGAGVIKAVAPDLVPDVQARTAARNAFRFPKGVSGNPGGLDRAYREARKIARTWAPTVMEAMAAMALDPAEDGRVRAVCGFGVLDRAGLKPIDYEKFQSEQRGFRDIPPFNPRDYTPEELDVIDAALRLVIAKRDQKKQTRGEPTARDAETGVPIEAEVVEDGERE